MLGELLFSGNRVSKDVNSNRDELMKFNELRNGNQKSGL